MESITTAAKKKKRKKAKSRARARKKAEASSIEDGAASLPSLETEISSIQDSSTSIPSVAQGKASLDTETSSIQDSAATIPSMMQGKDKDAPKSTIVGATERSTKDREKNERETKQNKKTKKKRKSSNHVPEERTITKLPPSAGTPEAETSNTSTPKNPNRKLPPTVPAQKTTKKVQSPVLSNTSATTNTSTNDDTPFCDSSIAAVDTIENTASKLMVKQTESQNVPKQPPNFNSGTVINATDCTGETPTGVSSVSKVDGAKRKLVGKKRKRARAPAKVRNTENLNNDASPKDDSGGTNSGDGEEEDGHIKDDDGNINEDDEGTGSEADRTLITRKNRERDHVKWGTMFEALKEYRDENGQPTTVVPRITTNVSKLSTWVNNQRKAYHNKTLPLDRLERLKAINFVWVVHSSWENMYEKLVAFKENHGHANVPQSYKNDPQLGKWVNNQRNRLGPKAKPKMKKKEEQQKQRELLNKLGFVWCLHKNKAKRRAIRKT